MNFHLSASHHMTPRQRADRQIVNHALAEVRTFLAELQHGTKKYKTIASLGGQIAEAYRGRCVLELLQNAHDALVDASGNDPRLITFVLKTKPDPVLLISNSGCAFEPQDFKALCQLGQSPKDPNKSVGNKGLGFRSVLEVTSVPEIWSTPAAKDRPAFMFRFDPSVRHLVANSLKELNAIGVDARSPFDRSAPLVDWIKSQMQRYREQLSEEQVDAPREAETFLSPYDIPLLIEEPCPEVDELLRCGHVTVVRLPVDGGRANDVAAAVESVKDQLEGLLELATTLFLPRLKTLVVEIDGDRTTIERTVDATIALDGHGDGHRQTVEISRTGPTRNDQEIGRFRVWTRALGGVGDPERATLIRDAVRHLPNKWPNIDRVEVGIAVREGDTAACGRFVIFLPTEMETGTGAHVNAPFYGSLERRQIPFKDKYNKLLLDCVTDLCLDALDDLLSGEAENARGQAIVDILAGASKIGDTGQSMLDMLRVRAAARDANLEDRAMILCDTGWITPDTARAMPNLADGLATSAQVWRSAAAFPVVSKALEGRQSTVETLVQGLGGSLVPTSIEWSRTLERVAKRMHEKGDEANWDDLLTSAIDVLPTEIVWGPAKNDDPLKTARFLPDQDGRLVSPSDRARVFFPPVVGIDDAAELVHTIPKWLKDRIAFIHEDVQTREHEPPRNRTPVHNFLRNRRFARGFEREEIIQHVVLEAVPPMPALLGSGSATRCAQLLDWTLRLLPEKPPQTLFELLEDLPVACHGGWYPAKDAVFGPGWPDRGGDDLWVLCKEIDGEAADRLRNPALLPPNDPRWGSNVENRSELFQDIGVASGLRLRPVEHVRFWMQKSDYKLPANAPPGIDQAAWDKWHTAVRHEAQPKQKSWFEYSLEDVFTLSELHGVETLTSPGRRALSRLLLASLPCWRSSWGRATVRRLNQRRLNWPITSPLKHSLSTMSWLSDGDCKSLPLSERWLVPPSHVRGQQDRFRHLRPLSPELSRTLEANPELTKTLRALELNTYPTDGERIGPELLDALADAWRTRRGLSGRFNVFLGQVRHAWQHLDEQKGLPTAFLVRTDRLGFEVRNAVGLADVFLPDDSGKARSLRESGAPLLEMATQVARRLASTLVNATPVRLASQLKEQVLIDDVEWSSSGVDVRALADTHYNWLTAPLLAIAAHGGPNPTGMATKRWDEAFSRLKGAGVVECKTIVVELVSGEKRVAASQPVAWWLEDGNVLAVTRSIGTKHERLAPAAQAILDRQDLLKDLRLVLAALEGDDQPSTADIERAMDRADIDAQAYADIQGHWAGNTGLVASRVRPVPVLLGIVMAGFETAAADAAKLAKWLEANVSQWGTEKLMAAARRSHDDHEMGLAAWRALGEIAQLPRWNEALEQLGQEYRPVENTEADEQTMTHIEAVRPLLQALARNIAIESDDPLLFRTMEDETRNFKAPAEWSKQWWEMPFAAVTKELRLRYEEAVAGRHLQLLSEASSIDGLRADLEARGIPIDPDPYETARVNEALFRKVLLNAHDLYRTWLETTVPDSKASDRPTTAQLGAEAYLSRLSNDELWHRALAVLGDQRFADACGDVTNPASLRERLGLSDREIKARRHEREKRERQAAREPKTMDIAGKSYPIQMIDYATLLREHLDNLQQPDGPRASKDEFTRLGIRSSNLASGGSGSKKGRTSHPNPSPDEAAVIGIVGEIHAYRYLRNEFGRRAVTPRAWVSKSRLQVIPLLEGQKDRTSDGFGFDFRFSHAGVRWLVEVKATTGDNSSFDLGISQIEAATAIARGRSTRSRWTILRVRDALSRQPQFDWLPNPFEERFRKYYRLREGGMIVSYARRKS